MLLFVLLASFLIAGLMAIVRMMKDHRAMSTLRNMRELVRGFMSFGLRPHPTISLDNPELPKLPFGVAAAIGTMVCFAAARWVSDGGAKEKFLMNRNRLLMGVLFALVVALLTSMFVYREFKQASAAPRAL